MRTFNEILLSQFGNQNPTDELPIGPPRVYVEKDEFMIPIMNKKTGELLYNGWKLIQPTHKFNREGKPRFTFYLSKKDNVEDMNKYLFEMWQAGFNIGELRANKPILPEDYVEYLRSFKEGKETYSKIAKRQVVINPKTKLLSLDKELNPIYRETGLIPGKKIQWIETKKDEIFIPDDLAELYAQTGEHIKKLQNEGKSRQRKRVW